MKSPLRRPSKATPPAQPPPPKAGHETKVTALLRIGQRLLLLETVRLATKPNQRVRLEGQEPAIAAELHDGLSTAGHMLMSNAELRAMRGNTAMRIWLANVNSLRTKVEEVLAEQAEVKVTVETHVQLEHLKGVLAKVKCAHQKAHLAPANVARTSGTGVIVQKHVQLQPLWSHPSGRACLVAVAKGKAQIL
eukprot:5687109-Amphidinium_carterae.1